MSKNILLVTNDPWGDYSGWKKHSEGLVKYLASELSFTILTYNTTPSNNVISIYNGNGRFCKAIVIMKYFFFLIRHKQDFDTVYMPKSHLTVLPLILLSNLFKKKSITRISGAELNGSGIKQLIKLKLLRASSSCIALNQTILRALKSNRINAKFIPNGINSERFFPDHSRRIDKNCLKFCALGSFSERKGTRVVINAFLELRQSGIEGELVLIGPYDNFIEKEDEYINDCHEIIKTSDYAESIKLLGYISNPEEILRSCDIILFPSLGEGMPNALLEAMACGCIPFANDIAGVQEIIEDEKNGYLMKDFTNSKSYSKKIQQVIQQNDLSLLKEETLTRIRESFLDSIVYREYKSLMLA